MNELTIHSFIPLIRSFIQSVSQSLLRPYYATGPAAAGHATACAYYECLPLPQGNASVFSPNGMLTLSCLVAFLAACRRRRCCRCCCRHPGCQLKCHRQANVSLCARLCVCVDALDVGGVAGRTQPVALSSSLTTPPTPFHFPPPTPSQRATSLMTLNQACFAFF